MSIQGIVQIAGVIDQADANLLVECGVDWLGFPFRLPVHGEDLSEDAATKIIQTLRPPHAGVLITYLDDSREILELCSTLGVRRVQLHGAINMQQIQRIKTLDPDLFVVKSLIVHSHNQNDLREQVASLGTLVDAFITDTYDPVTGATGATGKTHDWRISRMLVEMSPKPIILAGGLHPGNVRRAIREVKPAAVDAHTGVEGPDGRKSSDLVHAFVDEARAGFAEINR